MREAPAACIFLAWMGESLMGKSDSICKCKSENPPLKKRHGKFSDCQTKEKRPCSLFLVMEPTKNITEDNAPAYVAEWLETESQLAVLKKKEMEMRKQIFALLFPEPKEGANTVEFFGIPVTGTHKVTRNLDEAALDTVMQEFPEDSPYRQDGVLIKYKPSFIMDTYRAMPEQERKIFEQALKIDDGAPSLELKAGKGVDLVQTLKAIAGEANALANEEHESYEREKAKKAKAKKPAAKKKKK